MEERIKELEEALKLTLNMLIDICPDEYIGDKQLMSVITKAEEALKI
jgi:hypothetical protein